jgi:hypothetical protein
MMIIAIASAAARSGKGTLTSQRGVFVKPVDTTLLELGDRNIEYARLHKRSWKRDVEMPGNLLAFFGQAKLGKHQGTNPVRLVRFLPEDNLRVETLLRIRSKGCFWPPRPRHGLKKIVKKNQRPLRGLLAREWT